MLCPRYPDYHPSLPGATLGGRTLDSAPFDTSPLGELAALVLRGPASTPVTHAEWERWRFAHRFDEDLLARRDEAGDRDRRPRARGRAADRLPRRRR